jgi:serine/threonine protein phosphatase PrpC
MSSNPPTDPAARSGGFLARLKGMVQSMKPGEKPTPVDAAEPTWDTPALPVAVPVPPGAGPAPAAVPVAVPATPAEPAPAEVGPAAPAAPAAEAPVIRCPVCDAPNPKKQESCHDCGYYYSAAELEGNGSAPAAAAPAAPAVRLKDRYVLGEKMSERLGVTRYRALDHGDGSAAPVPVVILAQALPPPAEAVEAVEAEPALAEEVLPSFDEPPPSSPTVILPTLPTWPSVGWERNLLRTLEHPALPRELEYFTDDTHEYLVEEVPTGKSLWDAYDDPDASSYERFGWLEEVAEALQHLHKCGAMVEGLRPDIVVITEEGHARFTDLDDLLPLPMPPDTPVRGRLYTAPELLAGQGEVDARADLYSFGAMLYALHVGRELTEKVDFDRPGHPKPFIPRFPDIHPAFGRLTMKTFRREVEARFPTDEAGKEDPTGFTELIRTLGVLRRTYDNVRLEIASWTTTGVVRTGNEDAFALIHATESRQDDLGEAALVLLCDGMGGYEAGEVAAALAIQALRQTLVRQKPFTPLGGGSLFPADPLTHVSHAEGHAAPAVDVEAVKGQLKAALKEANRQVFAASRAPGSKRRGMGCTAEVVYVDGRNVVVGHVGDSRTYHLHEGRMVQMTRDQTLVNRLVELGTLSAEEAETHPRRNELRQAIGGQPDVEPGLYAGVLKPGDWVVVCSDGLTNHVTAKDLQQLLQSEAQSAEMAARRLVNLTNIEGATDNCTVVVIRCT